MGAHFRKLLNEEINLHPNKEDVTKEATNPKKHSLNEEGLICQEVWEEDILEKWTQTLKQEKRNEKVTKS